MASVTDPATWCSYEEAVAAATRPESPYSGIGFVLTHNDPYSFIDLDDCQGHQINIDRQVKIFNEFDSYSEYSPSGKGLHIIVKGRIPNGRRRGAVEVYSAERYMTMTGCVYKDSPINERHTLLQILWQQMGGAATIDVKGLDQPEVITDVQLIDRALNAANGEKFKTLLMGHWQMLYGSQSEADYAFIDIIAFYSQNRAQIARIFRACPLGQRDKAKRDDYVERMISRAFDRHLPPIDIHGLSNAWSDAKAAMGQAQSINADTPPQDISGDTLRVIPALGELRKFWEPVPLTPPPGLMGEIAQFIYLASPRPVAETAIAAAIGLMAGITGRAYNVSGTGLNQYVLFLAATGIGKEALSSGISKLLKAIRARCPASVNFRGPAEIASGQALLKHLSDPTKRCFVSIVGEFGLMMQKLSHARASGSEIMLKKVLLDVYNKSGANDELEGSIYADKGNNTDMIKSPSVSLLGESTPETFYAAIDERMIADGLLPRFTFIEYTGKRPRRNKNHETVEPSFKLIEQLSDLAGYSLMLQHGNSVCKVGCTPEAMQFMDKLDELVDDAINETKEDALRQLWNRAHIKTLKMAALVAVGNNMNQPVIDIEAAKWAYNVVSRDILTLVTRFSKGEIGKNNDENKQSNAILRAAIDYLTADYRNVVGYGVAMNLHNAHIIPHVYISRKLSSNSIFVNDRKGATEALRRAISGLLDTGDLTEIGKHTLQTHYNFKGRAYMLGQPDKLPADI
jgi:hypothetical protein